MKLIKQKIFLMAILGLSLSGTSQASLFDRGGGMVYDDVLDITWMQDAGYAAGSVKYDLDGDGEMTWTQAKKWVKELEYGGYTDWRLPTLSPVNGKEFNYTYASDGSTDLSFNITSTHSEMAYMFHQNLGNLSLRDINGDFRERDDQGNATWGITNTGFFENLKNSTYWLDIKAEGVPDSIETSDRIAAWAFNASRGEQYASGYRDDLRVWAVRSGDVTVSPSPIPVPAAGWLLGSALMGLAGLRKKR